MKIAIMAVSAALLATGAAASSDDAWEEFRVKVEESCAALVEGDAEAKIEVNPFGSESYGAALITLGEDETQERMVCIFDKQKETAEITGPFTE